MATKFTVPLLWDLEVRNDVARQDHVSERPSVTVANALLWDLESGVIVNNESSELIEMLNSAFDEWATAPGVDLNPPASRATQAALNEAHTTA